jgi:hypothetical protein
MASPTPVMAPSGAVMLHYVRYVAASGVMCVLPITCECTHNTAKQYITHIPISLPLNRSKTHTPFPWHLVRRRTSCR